MFGLNLIYKWYYLLFKLMGQFVETEVKNNKGRADAVVKTANHIYV